ncbi:MAG: ABC transporter permease [Christensenellales bacterium]|jgi:ribose/xylose/arabinose/galactoside ABC-type transport system permease subunit
MFRKLLKAREFTLFVLLILIFLVMGVFSEFFLTTSNVLIILNGMAMNMIIAVGVTIALIGGMIDFSVGSIMGCAGFTTAQLLIAQNFCGMERLPVFLCILVGIIIGGLLGVINGILVDRLKIPPIVVTIGTWMAYRGLGIIIVGGASISNLPSAFKNISQKWNLFGIPFNIIIMFSFVIIGIFVLKKVRFFHQAFFVGGNVDSARLVGINVRKFTIVSYAINGLLAGLAGVLTVSRLGSAPASMGQGVEFKIVTALLIGGVSFSGGSGSILGAFLGVLIMQIISNILALYSVSADAQLLIIGSVLILAVALDEYTKRKQMT